MKIDGYEKITDLRWVNLFDVRYTDDAGRGRTWQVASRRDIPECVSGGAPGVPDAVVIVPFHIGRNRLVIIREYRVALGGTEIGFPAGLVDPGETPEAAARRELAEETGLRVTRIRDIGPPVYSSSGLTDESVSIVHVDCDGTPDNTGTTGSEKIEPLLVDRKAAARLCRDPEVRFDVKSWLILSAFGAGHPLPGRTAE